ncbi:MAG: tryptophan--tRNA ligase [Tissierellia bacterium]|nr:tryptophan--tRNA ligase [Tissierellia bacterium]
MDKKIVYSGIQPSGTLTIGNYIGALRNFPTLQEEYNCIYCIVDMHAVTAPQEPKVLRQHTLDILALYLAVGIDPEKSILYIQSHVPQHVELAWLLNTITGVGQLQRMTQFKDKSQRSNEILAGILNYPVLMASDILLYQTDLVPVGDDQKQHIELTRDLAQRFNSRYSETFKIPDMMAPKVGARIMSLQDPEKKMSKSDEDVNAFISMVDDDATIRRKVKRAVTDSEGVIRYSDSQKAIKNLIDIYASFSGKNPEEIVKAYDGQGYGILKEELAEVIIQGMGPIRDDFLEIRKDKEYLEKVYREGAEKASYFANKTLRKVYRKMGFIPR